MPANAEIEVLRAPSPPPMSPHMHNRPKVRSRTTSFEFGGDDDSDEREEVDFRSASFTNLPAVLEHNLDVGIKRTFSENVLPLPTEIPKNATKPIYTGNKEILRRASQKSAKPTQLSSEPTCPQPAANGTTHLTPTKPTDEPTITNPKQEKDQTKRQGRSVSGTIRGLVKRPWSSPSRSPDPSVKEVPKESKKLGKSRKEAPDKKQQNSVEEAKPARAIPPVQTVTANPNHKQDEESNKPAVTPIPIVVEPPKSTAAKIVDSLSKDSNKDEKATKANSTKQKSTDTNQRPTSFFSRRKSSSRPPSPARTSSDESQNADKLTPNRKGTILGKGRRPLSAIIGTSRSESDPVVRKSPSLRSLKSMASLENLSLGTSTNKDAPPVPTVLLGEKFDKSSLDISRRKDPLWSAFRSLEGDFQKFQSKSSTLKANVIRSALLPFLARYSTHPANTSLRVEDLDRRVMILNKWWTGLMEMLNGRNNQASVSGTDRPVFLEAVTAIMTRPEWRIPPLAANSNTGSSSPTRQPAPGRSTTSLESSNSDFLAETIYSNVRNIFTQNLLSQMLFVVEKMSMKTAPASLVTFCGRACAYAFFYCPGVADILTRLWTITPESLRRILNEFGCRRGTNLRGKSEDIASLFPAAVRILSFDTHGALCRRLRQHPSLPQGASSIKWFGPWINRWIGRESDLFFVFTKHFHILVSEFVVEELPMSDRPCIPGLVLVHAQILSVLEATLYRQAQAGQEKLDHLSSALLEELDAPDAPATTMPLTAANAIRSMAENRLIMLLRDLLADRNPAHHHVQNLYATSFDNIIKAAARRMSLYDNNACFVLCDFMEEVLPITFRYQLQRTDYELFDWPFWFEVCRKMMDSQNTLTEVRTIAFVYSMWHSLINNTQRRRDLCLNWLLTPLFFKTYFNHWSPMVRGYFYRLLCWRIARIDEEGAPDAEEILRTLKQRIDETWAQFTYLKHDAEARNVNPPSTAPCSPAPGRRLVILRTDSQPTPAHLFMSFEKVGQYDNGHNQLTPYQSHSSLLNTLPAPEDTPSTNKKRWSMFKGMVPFTSPGNARPGEVTPPGSAEDPNGDLISVKSLTSTKLAEQDPGVEASHQAFSFKFSLEWLDRPSWPSKNRQISPPKLPAVAENAIQPEEKSAVNCIVEPRKPGPTDLEVVKYCGRALAEWAQVVSESNSFFERRGEEGVPTSKLVETPTLSVESFRMFG